MQLVLATSSNPVQVAVQVLHRTVVSVVSVESVSTSRSTSLRIVVGPTLATLPCTPPNSLGYNLSPIHLVTFCHIFLYQFAFTYCILMNFLLPFELDQVLRLGNSTLFKLYELKIKWHTFCIAHGQHWAKTKTLIKKNELFYYNSVNSNDKGLN